MSRAAKPNDYAVLGLRPGATMEAVRAAYRSLAKVHHPDRNPGDPSALATFARISESYAALREAAEHAAPAPTPLAAARAARRRGSSRRGSGADAARLADLPVGAALWVDAGAVMVAPDRTATLRPDATGSAFPSATNVIRVERRGDGHHVFMPPQPPARWPLAAKAESAGLLVSALWVGDRQDGDAGSLHAARVPLRLISGTAGEMQPGDRGWAPREALDVDAEGNWTLDLAQPVSAEPHRATPLRVLREEDGFRVHAELPANEWAPAPAQPAAVDGRAPVLTAILAGRQYPEPPRA